MPLPIDLRSPSSSPISLAFSDDEQDRPLAAVAVASGSRRNRQPHAEHERRRPRTINLHDGPDDGRGLREILDQSAAAAAAGRYRPPQPPPPAPARIRRYLPSPGLFDDDDVDALSEWGEHDEDDMDLFNDEDDVEEDDDYNYENDNGNGVAVDDNSEIGSEDEFVITGANVAPNRFIPPPLPPPIVRNPIRPLRHNRANVGAQNNRDFERAMQQVDRAVAAQRQNPQQFQNPHPRNTPVDRFREALDEIDRAVAQRGREHDAIIEDDLRRRILSPPAQEDPAGPARRAPIGFGGAVLRAGNRHVNFAPIPPPAPGAPGAAGARARVANIREPAAVAAYRERIMNQVNLMGGDGGFDLGLGLGLGRGRWGGGGEGLGAFYADMLGRGVGGGAGPAGYGGFRREEDIQKLISSIPTPTYSKPRTGFTSNFEIEEDPSNDPIVIDDEGMVVLNSAPKRKSYLICIKCQDPLLVSGAYRDPSDRVWALKCGHLLDQKCLNKLSTPLTDKELATVDKHPPLLDETEPPKKKTKARARKSKKEQVEERKPDEYEWKCPIKGCQKKHKSVDVGGVWVNKDGQGAIAVYA